ncbi:unnamed protein product [Phyllotreta striolata]|uniref:Chorein N-terminal domain-containing protein n=1 Tax=Phyllotreta striolata TaxID=444603 RepID=A0A9N9TUM4_PHYSR|nr:unnamed protein product [Phyllotreta striolata]
MFKLESYITPILLSYVNKYISNFKTEDSQVSFWGGDAVFNNLELNLQVLEQELHLPFSFVSGSIRELLIHVPWTKLASEPITITINTIECIFNLKGEGSNGRTESVSTPTEKKENKEIEAPQGYVQLLINKIVSNIRIYCNNLILKYVEEDIVLSINVKLLKFESADNKWEPAYIDISPAEVILRKVITINDLTLCLDKRNASGKIEIYMEPMLYKCSMTMHLFKNYHSAHAGRASITRFDIYCNNMEFSMTEQQVPMFMRLLMLIYTLKQKQLGSDTPLNEGTANPIEHGIEDNQTSWSSWAWSYVSSVLPAPWDDELQDEDFDGFKGHTVHFGSYIDNLSITFKVSEASPDRGNYYNAHKKIRYNPMLCLQLQGIYCETIIHGLKWLNSTCGISQAVLLPMGSCSCSHTEIPDHSTAINYLKIGSEGSSHKTDSLFDAEAVENKGQRRMYNTSWDHHMTVYTESVLLDRTPAFCFDYLYQIEVPSDTSSEVLSELGSDFEFSNLMENANMRMCVGPLKLRICSGLFHRIGSLQAAASYYDYPPYAIPKPEKTLQDIHPPSEEDFDALNEFIPTRSMRITFFAPIIELDLMDHPYFQPTKGMLFVRKKKKGISPTSPSATQSFLPKLSIECQFIDISSTYPMYVNRLVHTTCQLPDPPAKLFEACYSHQNVKIVGLCSQLIVNKQQHTTILTPSSFSYSTRHIAKPQFWVNPNIPHEEQLFESDTITLNGTNAKMMVVALIVGKMLKMDSEGALSTMKDTSILSDASKDDMPFMELCIESIRFKRVQTNSTISMDMSLGSIKAFIFEPVKGASASTNDIQQILFISGPDPKPSDNPQSEEFNLPLFTATIQYPLEPDNQRHPPILLFNLQEIRICIDPMLCRWLLYYPQSLLPKQSSEKVLKTKTYETNEPILSDTPRRITSLIETVHSSSDRELFKPVKVESPKEETVDLQEKIYNFLIKWFDVWKGMFICGDISQCTVYFPLVSLSAIGSQGIQEAVESAVNKKQPPDILIITLPLSNVRSAHRQSIKKYLNKLPVTLPASVWSPDTSSFPWTMSVSELSCYTVQFGNKLSFLNPFSLSATVGLSTKSNADAQDSNKIDIGPLGIYIHVDVTPILISTSEVQVYLFASILYGLIEVSENLMPDSTGKSSIPEAISSAAIKDSSVSLTENVIREVSFESLSDQTPTIATNKENPDEAGVKLTAWVQWTITRFTVELLSNDCSLTSDSESSDCRLNLVIDAEDIVSSIDFQNVYLKMKSKIGSMSIQHYKKSSPKENWQPGPYTGVVMRIREDAQVNQRHEDNGFINVTITRASCQHAHTLWGAVQKKYMLEPKRTTGSSKPELLSQSRYITEIVVNVQPIDFVLSFNTLRSFYQVIAPVLKIPVKSGGKSSKIAGNALSNFTNQNLPLAYLECQDIRVVLPSKNLVDSLALQDCLVVQIDKISLTPSAVNPICRTPFRPDLYERAAHSRILNVPGSDVEDRQYELNITGISVSTGIWDDVQSIFAQSLSAKSSHSRSFSENPALEWNSIDKGQPQFQEPLLDLWHIIDKFDISVIAAPAMVYKDSTVICGHSVEINLTSDINIALVYQQFSIAACLLKEFQLLVEPVEEKSDSSKPKITFPYGKIEFPASGKSAENLIGDSYKDSGFETSDIRSVNSSKNLKTDSERNFAHKQSISLDNLPIEALFTAGKLTVSFYEVDLEDIHKKWTKKLTRRMSMPLQKRISLTSYNELFDDDMDDIDENAKKIYPLFCICIDQPNAFLSYLNATKKIQISCFNFAFKVGGMDHFIVNEVLSEDSYSTNLIETKSGHPNPNTGVFPAFLTLKYSKISRKCTVLDVEIGKPTKFLCSPSKCAFLLDVFRKIADNMRTEAKDIVLLLDKNKDLKVKEKNTLPYVRPTVVKSKFYEIKNYLYGITNVNFKIDQAVFCIVSDSGHEVQLSFEKSSSSFSITTRPEKISLKTNFQSATLIMLNEMNQGKKNVLLNPWSFSFNVFVFWEPWQHIDCDPQIQVNVKSENIVIDISPETVRGMQTIVKEVEDVVSSNLNRPQPAKRAASEDSIPRKLSEKEQHYKDDLRAGAFQFIDANSDNADELPLPYQVVFWNAKISAMAWRYPQPRALTKIRVFPVPFKGAFSNESQDEIQISCSLQYWSECRTSYLPYAQFYMSESEVCHLKLPKSNPQPVVASTWRVVITVESKVEGKIVCKCPSSMSAQMSPRALAACMRIDSYFNRNLVPNICVSLEITKIDVSLTNNFDKLVYIEPPSFLKRFTSDYLFPDKQKFLTLSLFNVKGHLTCWERDVSSAELRSSAKCTVLDYHFLTEQPFVEPFNFELRLDASDRASCELISKPVRARFGPNVAHTLAVSAQVWDRAWPDRLIVMTRLVVCNDTHATLRFGQAHTDEEVSLGCRKFHLYSWRSQKKAQQLRVGVESNEYEWSEPFGVYEDGTQLVEFEESSNVAVYVSIKSLSATQKKITIFAQLIVANMLMEHFEMKVVEAVKENKDVEFRNTPTELVPSRNTTPSIFLRTDREYYLRLRFYGLDSAWTGDVPLKAHYSGSQPWLVKVPLQERGQFLSIWCRIVTEEIEDTKRILAILWPLFTVKSNLPVSSNVHIETPTLNVHLDSTVEGRGRLQQLYCPGTIDHSHQLTFKMDNQNSTSNPYVPLNYSLVDQSAFFKKSENGDIEENLSALEIFSEVNWPMFGDELDEIDWIVEDQPLTHVQVRYQNASPNSCSLLVELLPWCLAANTLGIPVSLMLNGTELCRIPHHGIVAPPKLEGNFNMGISMGGSRYYSEPLQLAKSDWSQTFYMPTISGTLPIEGSIKAAIKCDSHVCCISVSSTIANEIRLLKISSTHVLTNQIPTQLQVICLAVSNGDKKFNFPKNADRYSFALLPCLDKSQCGVSIIKWYTSAKSSSNSNDYALYMSFCTDETSGWSCPIRVDRPFLRKSFCITATPHPIAALLTCQEHKGQLVLSLFNDNYPQTLIANSTGRTILCGQSAKDGSVAEESQHFNWNCRIQDNEEMYYSMPLLGEKFPELPQYHFPEHFRFACESQNSEKIKWSQPINITHNYEQYLRIPPHGDIKVIVVNSACTTFINLQSTGEMEINASDIRTRLSMNELDKTIQEEAEEQQQEEEAPSSSNFHPEEIHRAMSDSSISKVNNKSQFQGAEDSCPCPRTRSDSILSATSPLQRSLLVSTLPTRERWALMKFRIQVETFTVTFASDLKEQGRERWEIASLICDNVVVDGTQTEKLKMKFSISDVQLDNQLYSRHSYDFPVLLKGQEGKERRSARSVNIPLENLEEIEDNDALITADFTLETWTDKARKINITGVKYVKINVNPISIFIEDTYVACLMDYFNIFVPTNLICWQTVKNSQKLNGPPSSVLIPDIIIWQSSLLAKPLSLRSLSISPISLSLSVHYSVKLYIALDQSPLQFGKLERRRLFTTPYRLGHALTMHYLSDAIFGAGWVVSSLELLGSPGGLARAMGTGLRDFVSLPLRGFIIGPMAFLRGITQGSASLMRHVTAGTLQSVTKLASSVARNLDRLTLDEEHVRRTEEQRKRKPQGLAQGFMQGLTGLGVSLLGAIGGVAHHPLQFMIAEGVSPISLVTGVGLGLVGMVTKPLSGAAELVALTGQGLLQGAGWNNLPEARSLPSIEKILQGSNSSLKYLWKYLENYSNDLLYVCEGTSISNASQYETVALILTTDVLIVFSLEQDAVQKVLNLSELAVCPSNDPTLLVFKIIASDSPKVNKEPDEESIDMDPDSRARVEDYVKKTTNFMLSPKKYEYSDEVAISVSPLSSVSSQCGENTEEKSTLLTYYVNLQNRNYFLCLLELALKRRHYYSFEIL